MRIKIFRKNDSQEFTGVTSLKIKKRGWLFSHLYADVEFGEGASTHYVGKEHDVAWKIDHHSNPGMGMDFCEKIEIGEDVQGLPTNSEDGGELMGKKVKVVTKCGEVSYHNFDQDVDSVEIIEEPRQIQKLNSKTYTILWIAPGSDAYIESAGGQYYVKDAQGNNIAGFCPYDLKDGVTVG